MRPRPKLCWFGFAAATTSGLSAGTTRRGWAAPLMWMVEGGTVTADVAALIAAYLLAGGMRYATGTWAHPSALFAGAWALFLSVSALLPQVIPYPIASWVIIGAIAAVSLGAPLAISSAEVVAKQVAVSKGVMRFVAIGSISAVMSAIVTQAANGVSIVGSLSLESISLAARALTTQRYDGTMIAPALAIVLLALTYGAALAAPFAASQCTGLKKVAVICLPAAGAALYAALTTARAPFLISVALTVSAWLIVRAVATGGRPKLPARSMVGIAAAAAAAVAVFAGVAATRSGGFSATSADALLRTAGLYAGGSTPAFNMWVAEVGTPQLGAQTFAGIAQYLLMDTSIGSAYEGFVRIGGGLMTNVFTAFRPLAEDFTLQGMFVALALFGVGSAQAYRLAVVKGSVLSAVIAASCGAYILFSQTTSLFSFTNVTFGLLVAAVVLTRGVQFTESSPALTIGSDLTAMPRAEMIKS